MRRWFTKCALAGLVFGTSSCSTALDPRQTVSSSNLGLLFFGEVRAVYVAREIDDGLTFYDQIPASFFDEAAEIAIGERQAAALRILGEAISALALDAESRIARSRCIYIVRTDDSDIFSFVRRNVLNTFDDDPDTLTEAERSRFDPEPMPAGLTPELRKHITLAQSCNPALGPMTEVLMTVNELEATIHPLDDTTRSLQQELKTDEKLSDG